MKFTELINEIENINEAFYTITGYESDGITPSYATTGAFTISEKIEKQILKQVFDYLKQKNIDAIGKIVSVGYTPAGGGSVVITDETNKQFKVEGDIKKGREEIYNFIPKGQSNLGVGKMKITPTSRRTFLKKGVSANFPSTAPTET